MFGLHMQNPSILRGQPTCPLPQVIHPALLFPILSLSKHASIFHRTHHKLTSHLLAGLPNGVNIGSPISHMHPVHSRRSRPDCRGTAFPHLRLTRSLSALGPRFLLGCPLPHKGLLIGTSQHLLGLGIHGVHRVDVEPLPPQSLPNRTHSLSPGVRREVDLGGVGNQQHPCTLARLGPRLAPVRHHDLLMTHLLVLEKPIRRQRLAPVPHGLGQGSRWLFGQRRCHHHQPICPLLMAQFCAPEGCASPLLRRLRFVLLH